jgi:hypothetical protein
MGFIDTMGAEGHAVESICRVLREQDFPIAARTYRAWRRGLVDARTVTDAQVVARSAPPRGPQSWARPVESSAS